MYWKNGLFLSRSTFEFKDAASLYRTSSFLFQQSRLSLKSSAQYSFQGVELCSFLEDNLLLSMQNFCKKRSTLLRCKVSVRKKQRCSLQKNISDLIFFTKFSFAPRHISKKLQLFCIERSLLFRPFFQKELYLSRVKSVSFQKHACQETAFLQKNLKTVGLGSIFDVHLCIILHLSIYLSI